MESKLISIEDAAALVHDGDMVALGGNVLHRAPMAFVRELARQSKTGLRVVKTAGAHDVDLLCACGCAASVDAGFISYETKYGLALHYRKQVESGAVKANEHACYTVICALRAAVYGTPFMPVRGLIVSDLLAYNDYFQVLDDPFGSGPIAVVKALRPDVAVIHVQQCDRYGNAIIDGPRFEDELMARAAKKVIVTAESIISDTSHLVTSNTVHIPHFIVNAVVHAPRGATPGSCYGKYDVDDLSLRTFIALKTKPELVAYLEGFAKRGEKYAGF